MTGEYEDAIDTADSKPARIKVMDKSKEPKGPKRKINARSEKPKRWPIILIVIVILLIIIIPIAGTLQMPVVNVVGMEVRSTGSGINLAYRTSATIEVQNPNIAGVTVLRIEGKFYVNGQYCGDFLREDPIDIAAQGKTTFSVEVQIKNTFVVEWNSNNPVRVVGTVTVQAPLSSWDIAFDETRDVHVP